MVIVRGIIVTRCLDWSFSRFLFIPGFAQACGFFCGQRCEAILSSCRHSISLFSTFQSAFDSIRFSSPESCSNSLGDSAADFYDFADNPLLIRAGCVAGPPVNLNPLSVRDRNLDPDKWIIRHQFRDWRSIHNSGSSRFGFTAAAEISTVWHVG